MIRHVFVWRVAPGHDGRDIVEILNTLPVKLSAVIKGWDIGQHKGDPGDNGSPWDGALITDFESWEDLDRYSTNPYHLSVVEKLMPMFGERAVVDYECGNV